jgi:hypothetical protein
MTIVWDRAGRCWGWRGVIDVRAGMEVWGGMRAGMERWKSMGDGYGVRGCVVFPDIRAWKGGVKDQGFCEMC